MRGAELDKERFMNRRPCLVAVAFAVAACAGRATPTAGPAPTRAPTAPAAAPAAPAEPTTLRYAAGTGHYRFESLSHVEQEAMGQTSKLDLSTAVLVTVAVADASGNIGVAVTIDSLSISAPMGGPGPAELAAAKGQTVHIVASPQGQIISLTPPDSASAAVRQVSQGFREFLPQLPAGSTAAGTTWSDTTSITTPSQGLAVTVHMARQHRVVGWEDHAGTRALHLAMAVTYTVSGSGEAQGQTIELAGSGQRSADAFVSAAGVYLGGTMSDSSMVNANVISAGIVVPVRSTTHSTFTRLP
jgi:hypothetical protein